MLRLWPCARGHDNSSIIPCHILHSTTAIYAREVLKSGFYFLWNFGMLFYYCSFYDYLIPLHNCNKRNQHKRSQESDPKGLLKQSQGLPSVYKHTLYLGCHLADFRECQRTHSRIQGRIAATVYNKLHKCCHDIRSGLLPGRLWPERGLDVLSWNRDIVLESFLLPYVVLSWCVFSALQWLRCADILPSQCSKSTAENQENSVLFSTRSGLKSFIFGRRSETLFCSWCALQWVHFGVRNSHVHLLRFHKVFDDESLDWILHGLKHRHSCMGNSSKSKKPLIKLLLYFK